MKQLYLCVKQIKFCNSWFLNDLKIVYSHKESIYFLIRLTDVFSPINTLLLGKKQLTVGSFEKKKRARKIVREKANLKEIKPLYFIIMFVIY